MTSEPMPAPRQVPETEAVPCPLCGASERRDVMVTKDYLFDIPGSWTISTCQNCQHLHLSPRPTVAALPSCYPDNYGPHQSVPAVSSDRAAGSADANDNDSAQRRAVPWYLKYLPLRRIPGLKSLYYWLTDDRSQPVPQLPEGSASPRILELGCATGTYLARLTAAGWRPVGIELSEAASEKARAAGFDVHTGTLDDYSGGQSDFDAVAAWMVLEHVFDPIRTLRQLHDHLRPGGRLLISVPNAGCWERFVFGSSWYGWEPPRHLHHFTPPQIRRILERAGFCNVTIVHQRNALYLIGSLGIMLFRIPFLRAVGLRLIRYPEQPNMWIQLMLSPLAHLLAAIRQGGRLTVFAERPAAADAGRSEEGAA